MSTLLIEDPRIVNVQVTDDAITAQLHDGRMISVPLVWSWRLSEATPEQRQNYEILNVFSNRQLSQYKFGLRYLNFVECKRNA